MKDYSELTRLGKIRRCRKIVLRSLECYDIKIKSLTFLDEASNIFFKLIDENNTKYAVKVSQDLNSNMDDSVVEMFFLNVLKRRLDHNVPRPVENRFGDSITSIDTSYEKKRVVVYEWLDGQAIDLKETPEILKSVGKLLAEIHNEMSQIGIPSDLKPKKMDKVLYFPTDDIFYKMDIHKHKVDSKTVKLLDYIIPYLDKKMMKLYGDNPFLIHGDLNPWNIRINNNEVNFIDFEDASLGHEIHDIAILLYFYQYNSNYELFKSSLIEGYRSIRKIEINEDDLLTLMMARRVNLMNYFIAARDELNDYLKINTDRLMDYLKQVHGTDFQL